MFLSSYVYWDFMDWHLTKIDNNENENPSINEYKYKQTYTDYFYRFDIGFWYTHLVFHTSSVISL